MEIIKIYRRTISNNTNSFKDDQDHTKLNTNNKDFVVVYLTKEFQDHYDLTDDRISTNSKRSNYHQHYFDELEDFVIFEQTVITTYEISKFKFLFYFLYEK